MAKERKPLIGIPMERTVRRERPGRWMPVVWLLFAVALTVGIIAAVQTFVPIDSKDRANSSLEEGTPAPATTVAASPSVAPLVPTTPSPVPVAAPVKAATPPPPTPTPKPRPTAESTPAPTPVAAAPTVPLEPSPPAAASPVQNDLVPGAGATLTVRTQAEWRDGGRTTGVTYLPPGTSVVIDEKLPDGKFRVHWREAEASVAPDVLVPVAP